MAVDAVGSVVNSGGAALNQTTLNQQEFLRLFLNGLQFQDPLEPVDNKEFLAQMAQFASLEQARQMTQSLESLVVMNSASQSVGLLGKRVTVEAQAGTVSGTVNAVEFTSEGPVLTIKVSDNEFIPNVRLSEINIVQNPTQP